ncbi:MAG: AAA family ATPase [Phaeodactylibacter sp.]|nr:AAA family ATPase [Phaeodactylibacter sp.]
MAKIPYGISNFSDLATQGYFFVDRTNYIEQLEKLGEKYLIFLRPRRFGKSLWISILQHYYGLEHKADFENLFGKYHIGRHPTPLANSYLVLRLEFSRIDTSTEEGTYRGFLSNVREGVEACMQAYPNLFSKAEHPDVLQKDSPVEVLKSFLSLVRRLPHKIYLLVDEYDHFANELISLNLAACRRTGC